MGSLISLKNMLIFSAVLLTIGSVSAQQAFAGTLQDCDCDSTQGGDWDAAFDCGIPTGSDKVCIFDEVQLNEVGVASILEIRSDSLFIGCEGDLTASNITVFPQASLINHGSVNVGNLFIPGLAQNSSSAFTVGSIGDGTIENISTICSQPIGGTVGSMSTVSLLVAGAQANTGWWIIALVGAVAVVGIVYKAKTNKTNKETL